MWTYYSSKNSPAAPDFCHSIWCQQYLQKFLEYVDGSHFGIFLRSEIASRLVEFGQHFIRELCSVGCWVWYPAIFALLLTRCLMNCRENLMHWIFLYLRHIPVIFIQQQIEGFTQEEAVHSAVVKIKRNTYLLMMKAFKVFKQTGCLPRFAQIQRIIWGRGWYSDHSDNYLILEEGYLLFSLNSSVNFI